MPRGSSVFQIHMDIDNTRDSNFDYDLNLRMRTPDGQECVVDSFNRVCPYAQKLNDVGPDQRGLETILVDRFVKATYMVYVTKGPAYNTCPQVAGLPHDVSPNAHKLFGFFAQNPIYSIFTNYLGHGFGGGSYSSGLGA